MKYLRCYGSGPGRTGNNGYVCLEQEKYVIDPKRSSYKPMVSYVRPKFSLGKYFIKLSYLCIVEIFTGILIILCDLYCSFSQHQRHHAR